METQFYLLFTIKSARGFENFAKFFLGDDREVATTIFQQLQGNSEVSEEDMLCIEFMETIEGLPINLSMIGCTLQQLGENCKIITKELFISGNLNS